MCLCVRKWLYTPILALNCRLQIEQVNSDCAESDDGPLALAFLSLRFLSASQILFASNWEAPLLMRQCYGRQERCFCSFDEGCKPKREEELVLLL